MGGSAVEDKAGKTRAEPAANTTIGPRAGKAAAAAGAAAVATLAMGSSAAATLIVGAQHAAPAAHAPAATRPRTEETATKIGAAVPVDQALMGKKPKVRGKKKGEKQSGLSQGARECFRKERAKDNGD